MIKVEGDSSAKNPQSKYASFYESSKRRDELETAMEFVNYYEILKTKDQTQQVSELYKSGKHMHAAGQSAQGFYNNPYLHMGVGQQALPISSLMAGQLSHNKSRSDRKRQRGYSSSNDSSGSSIKDRKRYITVPSALS